MKKVFLLLTTYYLLLTTVYAQNPVIAPEVRIPGKAQASVRRIQKPMTGVLFYRLSDSTMCVRNPDNSVTPLSGDAGTSVWFEINDSMIGWAYNGDTLKIAIAFSGDPANSIVDISGTTNTTQLRRMTGDTSYVVGVSNGDAFMRANTDGTDFDVIISASDPAGVKIQGKDTSTGNALTIYKGANSPFAGDTAVEFKNNGDVVIAKFAGSAQKLATFLADGTMDTMSIPAVDSLSLWQEDGNGISPVDTNNHVGIGTVSHIGFPLYVEGNQLFSAQTTSFLLTGGGSNAVFSVRDTGDALPAMQIETFGGASVPVITFRSQGASVVFSEGGSFEVTFPGGNQLGLSSSPSGGLTLNGSLHDITGDVEINSGYLYVDTTFVIETPRSPASGAACATGEITWDANYIYVCTTTGAWKRAALTGGY